LALLMAIAATSCARRPPVDTPIAGAEDRATTRDAIIESPGPRNAHAMVFDQRRGRVVLFGGADHERVRGDTWEYDGTQWRAVADSGPAPRTFAAAAYHSGRASVMVFGGNEVLFGTTPSPMTLLADLWEWNGARWTRTSVGGPVARAEAAMAYDSARDRLVLFGGYTITDSGRVRLGDTWEWDGRDWERVSTNGPRARNSAAMTYDPDRRRVVLFGGSTGRASNELWEWDGTAWLAVSADGEPRFNPAMTYDSRRSLVLLFGGWNGSARVAELAELVDGRRRPLPVAGPSARNHTAMVFDAAAGRSLLYGGHDGEMVFGDMWSFDGERWLRLVDAPPRPRVPNAH
jgi:hypothetical protein